MSNLVPAPDRPPVPMHPIDAEVNRQMAGVHTNTILLAVFLGWCGANWVYSEPKKTGPVILMLAAWFVLPWISIFTFGIPHFILWVVAVIMACSKDSVARYEADVRAKAEAEYVTRRQIGAHPIG